MKTCQLKIWNKSKNSLPSFQSKGASGVDLFANLDEVMVLNPHQVYLVPTGIHIELPLGYEAQIRARSGLSFKHGIILVNGIGTIDSDYRGEIKVILMNLLDVPYEIQPGERIAQMVVTQYIIPEFKEVQSLEELSDTDRGAGGFGHSGKH